MKQLLAFSLLALLVAFALPSAHAGIQIKECESRFEYAADSSYTAPGWILNRNPFLRSALALQETIQRGPYRFSVRQESVLRKAIVEERLGLRIAPYGRNHVEISVIGTHLKPVVVETADLDGDLARLLTEKAIPKVAEQFQNEFLKQASMQSTHLRMQRIQTGFELSGSFNEKKVICRARFTTDGIELYSRIVGQDHPTRYTRIPMREFFESNGEFNKNLWMNLFTRALDPATSGKPFSELPESQKKYLRDNPLITVEHLSSTTDYSLPENQLVWVTSFDGIQYAALVLSVDPTGPGMLHVINQESALSLGEEVPLHWVMPIPTDLLKASIQPSMLNRFEYKPEDTPYDVRTGLPVVIDSLISKRDGSLLGKDVGQTATYLARKYSFSSESKEYFPIDSTHLLPSQYYVNRRTILQKIQLSGLMPMMYPSHYLKLAFGSALPAESVRVLQPGDRETFEKAKFDSLEVPAFVANAVGFPKSGESALLLFNKNPNAKQHRLLVLRKKGPSQGIVEILDDAIQETAFQLLNAHPRMTNSSVLN